MPVSRLLALIGLSLAASPALPNPVMQPGSWEMKTSATRELPGKDPETTTRSQRLCLTAAFLASDPYLDHEISADKQAEIKGECRTDDVQRQPQAASWTLHCRMSDGSQLQSRIRNAATATTLSLHMVQDVRRPDGSQGRVTLQGEGRRLGECEEGADVGTGQTQDGSGGAVLRP